MPDPVKKSRAGRRRNEDQGIQDFVRSEGRVVKWDALTGR
ncbi:MAG: hypothetical protein OZSIB_3173 [Candidatus Ozemobacter sibiricus]|uniref:Uncharacterized protein n=1 Tax=Candidatus Ozemobacter sibiricus TaxID=2268124 RepID=A0A367ZRE5_9BACT|nr:MAG: hypothetical protein OZSIB_3173 [Candidatus Ozemobacter sibiricus]